MASARVPLRGLSAAVDRGPGTATIGRIGVGALGTEYVIINIQHGDGAHLSAALSIDTLHELAGWLGELVERGTAALTAGETLQ